MSGPTKQDPSIISANTPAPDAGNQPDHSGSDAGKDTPSSDDAKKLLERAQRFEGLLADREKKLAEMQNRYKDVDIEQWREMKAKLDEAERKAAESDPKKMEELFDRRLRREQATWEEKVTTISQELETLRKQNKTLAVTDKVMSEIGPMLTEGKVKKFIRSEIEARADRDEQGEIFFKDEDGRTLIRAGRYVTAKEFGEMLRDDYPEAFKPTASGGSRDAVPGQKNPSRGGRDYSTLTYDEYSQLPNQAEAWKHLSAEKKVEFAGRMKIGGQR